MSQYTPKGSNSRKTEPSGARREVPSEKPERVPLRAGIGKSGKTGSDRPGTKISKKSSDPGKIDYDHGHGHGTDNPKCLSVSKIILDLFVFTYIEDFTIPDCHNLINKFFDIKELCNTIDSYTVKTIDQTDKPIPKDSIDKKSLPLATKKQILRMVKDVDIKSILHPTLREKLCICPLMAKLSEKETDMLMLEYCKKEDDLRIVTVYPLAYKLLGSIKKRLNKNGVIIYQKTIHLTERQHRNLIWLYYIRETRMGRYPKRSDFWLDKVNSTYDTGKPLTVFLYRPNNMDTIRDVKERIRDACKYGFHSIHINDNNTETLQMAKALFSHKTLEQFNDKLYKLDDGVYDKFFDFAEKHNKLKRIIQDGVLFNLSKLIKHGTVSYDVADWISKKDLTKYLGIAPSNPKFSPEKIYNPDSFFYWFGVKCH